MLRQLSGQGDGLTLSGHVLGDFVACAASLAGVHVLFAYQCLTLEPDGQQRNVFLRPLLTFMTASSFGGRP